MQDDPRGASGHLTEGQLVVPDSGKISVTIGRGGIWGSNAGDTVVEAGQERLTALARESGVYRSFTQHWIIIGKNLRVLLLDFAEFTLFIPNIEVGKILPINLAYIEDETKELDGGQKLTFMKFIFQSPKLKIEAPVLNDKNVGHQVLLQNGACVFLSRIFNTRSLFAPGAGLFAPGAGPAQPPLSPGLTNQLNLNPVQLSMITEKDKKSIAPQLLKLSLPRIPGLGIAPVRGGSVDGGVGVCLSGNGESVSAGKRFGGGTRNQWEGGQAGVVVIY